MTESLSTIDAALADLSKNMQSDEARLRIAELIIEAVKIRLNAYQEMNRTNASTWKAVGGAAVAVVGAVVAIFVGGRR